MAKFKIELNDSTNIRDVLQQAYDLSDAQIVQAQNEINKKKLIQGTKPC